LQNPIIDYTISVEAWSIKVFYCNRTVKLYSHHGNLIITLSNVNVCYRSITNNYSLMTCYIYQPRPFTNKKRSKPSLQWLWPYMII